MINKNIYQLKKYCTEYQKIENYEEAVKSPLRYDLHHRLEIDEMQSRSDLIFLHLYYHRPPEELIFLEHGDHQRLHNRGERSYMYGKPAHNRGKQPSVETRQKISESLKGHEGYWKGRDRSTETRQKMSAAQKGKHWHLSAETRKKISYSLKGQHPSAETRQKISESHKGKHWHLENGKHVYTD